jgi:Family of unknown function (DUF6812)
MIFAKETHQKQGRGVGPPPLKEVIMAAQVIDYVKNYKNIAVKMSDGSEVKGRINIMSFPRLSDLMKHSTDKFITVLPEEEGGTRKVMIVNKDYIVWAQTED